MGWTELMNLMNLFWGCGLLLLFCGGKRAKRLTKQIDTPPFLAFNVHKVHGPDFNVNKLLINISFSIKNHELMNLLNIVFPVVIIIGIFLVLGVISMNFTLLTSSYQVHGFYSMFILAFFVQLEVIR